MFIFLAIFVVTLYFWLYALILIIPLYFKHFKLKQAISRSLLYIFGAIIAYPLVIKEAFLLVFNKNLRNKCMKHLEESFKKQGK